ncbi:hypothetical protein C9890_0102 [Perkinsus sp. BL_2016]|nr:hypothetical protein C9890_0102 [Perkinsus sp. BL_2016]
MLWNSGFEPFNKYLPTLPCIDAFSFRVNCAFRADEEAPPRMESLIDSKAELALSDSVANDCNLAVAGTLSVE